MISGNNLKVALRRLKLTQEKASELIGRSRTALNNYMKAADLDADIVNLINTSLGIDLTDFHEGPEVVTPSGKFVNHSNSKRKPGDLIPFYPADFIAGEATESTDVIIYPEYYMDIPQFAGCTAFNAYSDSMERLIPSGCILFGVKIEDWRSVLEFGKIYGIVCNDGRKFLKYIRRDKENKNNFILKSENPAYDDMDMPTDKIKNIWLIDGWLVKNT